jgi:hypothetical protein
MSNDAGRGNYTLCGCGRSGIRLNGCAVRSEAGVDELEIESCANSKHVTVPTLKVVHRCIRVFVNRGCIDSFVPAILHSLSPTRLVGIIRLATMRRDLTRGLWAWYNRYRDVW